MPEKNTFPNREEIDAFVKRHRAAPAIGAVIIMLTAKSDGEGSVSAGAGGPSGPAPIYAGE